VKPRAREHDSQNEIRNALANDAYIFRANVGSAWTGNKISKLPNGAVLIHDPRPFSTGLPAGFSDLFGFVPVVITPDMVGSTVAVFAAIEAKSSNGVRREKQKKFIKAVTDNGGRAGFARDVTEARDIIEGKGTSNESGGVCASTRED